jgi:hypothetical protein
MTTRSFTTLGNRLTVGHGVSSRWLVGILAVLVLGLGRPGFEVPLNPVSDREIDPVEQEDSESEEELALHFRSVFRRRACEHFAFAKPRFVLGNTLRKTSFREADSAVRISPHDFDLRNGLGAALRC